MIIFEIIEDTKQFYDSIRAEMAESIVLQRRMLFRDCDLPLFSVRYLMQCSAADDGIDDVLRRYHR